MSYRILMATSSTPFPTDLEALEWRDAHRPFGSYIFSNFKMPDITLSQISVEDDDGTLDPVYDESIVSWETGQHLTGPTYFGTDPALYSTETILSPGPTTILVDSAGNRFGVMFPFRYNPDTGSIIEMGARHALIILPLPTGTGENMVYPVFNPNETFSFHSTLNYYHFKPGLSYGPQGATCFTLGTMILTPEGERPIESLRPGDLVETMDHGAQFLRWSGASHLTAERLDLQPNLRPIRLAEGALGANCPREALTVSPQHRMLVRSGIAERHFGSEEVLVAACHLRELPGITVERPAGGVTYLHLLFDRHEILHANGAWSESLYTGPQAMRALSAAARREILAIFPELALGQRPLSSRRILSGKEGRKLATHHAISRRALAPAD